jgi:preprotein translocase subunit SecG
MTSLILAFIFLICGIILFYKANQIKINKNEQQE